MDRITNTSVRSHSVQHYEILELLGRGGMGIVYKARDLRLGRTVALKFLPSQLSHDAHARDRFVLEARAASALDHPNICTIHDIGESEDGDFYIVMAYYPGETLKNLVARGPLPLSNAVVFAQQMAAGLACAHETGIIHRDVKPANMIVTDHGLVKLLDFGLAKIASAHLSKTGSTMGTVTYMAPELVRGEQVDHRADIWALGVVLYEMLTGLPPFRGDYDQAVTYSILNKSPQPVRSLRRNIPPELEHIISRALLKDPALRYQKMDEVLFDLSTVGETFPRDDSPTPGLRTLSGPRPADPPRQSRTWTWTTAAMLGVGVALALLALVVFLPWTLIRPSVMSAPVPFTRTNGLAVTPAWSPEGLWLAYASDEAGTSDIWKRPVDGGRALRLTAGRYNERGPTWSPDGRYIAFATDSGGGGIHVISADGGPASLLSSFGTNPVWSPNMGTLAFESHGNLYVVDYPSGTPHVLVQGISGNGYPVWTRDGRHLLFWNRTLSDLYAVNVATKAVHPLDLVPPGNEIAGITLSADGKTLVFSMGAFGLSKALWHVGFDPAAIRAVDAPSMLISGVTDHIECAFSDRGTLAFTSRQLNYHLWEFPLDPASGLIAGQRRSVVETGEKHFYPALSADGHKVAWTSSEAGLGMMYTRDLRQPDISKLTLHYGRDTREALGSFSPDGRQIFYASTLNGPMEIWRTPFGGGPETRLTDSRGRDKDTGPTVSPDGRILALYSNRSGNWDIWRLNLEESGAPIRLTTWESNELYPAWSPDGSYLAFRTDRHGNGDIWVMEADGSDPQPVVSHEAEEGWAAWSPNQRWFYFTSDRSGSFNVWVQPAGGGTPTAVTTFQDIRERLPERALFTKFAVSDSLLIVPLERSRANIFLLENAPGF